MHSSIDLDLINSKIQLMKNTAEELKRLGANLPAIDRNIVRLLASIKMLEINISDLANLE